MFHHGVCAYIVLRTHTQSQYVFITGGIPGKTVANPRYATLMEQSRPFLRIRKFGSPDTRTMSFIYSEREDDFRVINASNYT